MDLKSSVAVVTGAGRGIGRAVAQEYASHGAKVALVSRTASQLNEVVKEIGKAGGTALAIPTDVTNTDAVKRMADKVERELGPIDILMNNAGSYQGIGPVYEAPPDKWLADITVNLYGVFLCSNIVLPRMLPRKQGYVINIIGGGTAGPLLYGSSYGSSKAAAMRLTETMALELKDTGIKVFALSPGLVRTELVEHQISSPAGQKWLAKRLSAMFDEGRGVPPTIAAKMAVALVSGKLDKLAGRAIRADRDSVEQLVKLADEIVEKDQRVLRMIAYPSN